MDFYTTSLVVGAGGLALMGLTGLGRHGHVGHHGLGRGGHTPVGHGHAGHTHVPGDHGHADGRSPALSPRELWSRQLEIAEQGHHGGFHLSQYLWSLTSPRVLFSLLLGFGTWGLALNSLLSGPFLLAAAVVGGVVFERALVTPLWDFTMRFASKPAMTLEAAVSEDATAVTNFDANGQGLVSLELDGQIVQILGTLAASDRELVKRVPAGTRLRIEEVDTERNRCTVSVR